MNGYLGGTFELPDLPLPPRGLVFAPLKGADEDKLDQSLAI
jgi:hypothetical protein